MKVWISRACVDPMAVLLIFKEKPVIGEFGTWNGNQIGELHYSLMDDITYENSPHEFDLVLFKDKGTITNINVLNKELKI